MLVTIHNKGKLFISGFGSSRGMYLGFLLLALLNTSCREEQLPELNLPPTPVLSVRKNWAVVERSYLPLYAQPGIESEILWHARQGEVFEVLEQSLETEYLYTEESYWFLVQHSDARGWAFGAGIQSYASREEAINAASWLASREEF